MDLTTTFESIIGDDLSLAKFVRLAMFSSDKITISQLTEIYNKKPNITEVRLYDEWKKEGRQVWLGEKGIPFRDENSTYKSGINFCFDIKQTKGAPKRKSQLTYERFRQKFDEISDLNERFIGRDLSEIEEQIKVILRIKERSNVRNNESNNSRNERNNRNGLRVDDRADNGDRGVSQAGQGTPSRNENAIDKGNESENRTIRIASGKISNVSQLSEIYAIASENDVRERIVSNRRESGNVQGEENTRVFSTESELPRESQSLERVSDGNGRDNIRGDYKAVRYGLSEEDFIKRAPKERCQDNILAIKTIKNINRENRNATLEEQKIIAKYVGWGGLQEAFNPNNPSWNKEFKELRELLSSEEYKTASDSVLNAHFTPKGVIDGMYAGLERLGVKNAKVLEPSCGTGNFIGLAPTNMNLSFDAVEIDGITARIAKALYPTEKITESGFEDIAIKNDAYDVVIGNVPFGDYKLYDSEYNKYKFVIHDYFLAKSIDKVRPGGIIAIITGKGTLDKQNSRARKYIAERAILLGAYRLPNNTFKENAGTEAVADILFFQKRAEKIPSEELAVSSVEWLNSSITQENVAPLNNYYINHEENILGNIEYVSGRFGTERTIIATSEDIGEQLKQAIKSLPENVYNESSHAKPSQTEQNEEKTNYTNEELDELNIRNFGICLINNKAYIRQNNELIEPLKKSLQGELSEKTQERVNSYITLATQVKKLIALQCDNCLDNELAREQEKLSKIYDNFIKKFGCISGQNNHRYFEEDIDYPLVSSIEEYDKETDTATKGDMFTQRTIRKAEVKKYTDDIHEALAISRNITGEVDIRYIERLTRLTYEEIISKLKGEIFQSSSILLSNTEDKKYIGWQTREEFLSGNVVFKLDNEKYQLSRIDKLEQYSVEEKEELQRNIEFNIEELKTVQPTPLTYNEIKARLGATWVEDVDYTRFLSYLLNAQGASGFEVVYNHYSGQYSVSAPSWVKWQAEAKNIWGTERMNAVDIFDCAINSRPPTVWDKIDGSDGKEKRVINKAETAVAREKVKDMNEAFSKWLWQEERQSKYEKIYNKRFNSEVLPEYNGEHLTFDGMNNTIQLREHQKTAIARVITGRNTLLHHGVGAGKTYEIIASAMKLRQYGIANKPMIVVPNPLVMQWAKEVKTLYPNAKILLTTKEEFEKKNRQRFISKIATGDWDMVILSESQFRRIPVSKERQLRKTEEIIDKIKESIEDYNYRHYNGARSLTVKALKATLKKKETKYKELQDKVNKVQDDVIEFEKLGVDWLFVDEAHMYKNKEIETSMTNVAGITSGGSERAFDLEMKVDYLSELHNGDKGVVFATGTPISNSMAEMFTMMSYLNKSELERKGIQYFDAWASTFGEVINSWELNTSGSGVKARTRFARFVNLPELQKMYRSFADVKTSEMLHLPVPTANRETITIAPTDQLLAYNDEIIQRGERIEGGGVDPTEDNMLKLTSDGKKLALDVRCLEPSAFDEENSKVNICIKKVFDIYENTKENKSTQVIFCDQSTPKNNEWSVYGDIKDKLVALGVPQEEIAFIHEADTDKAKERLFADMNSGKVRVLIGSTQKCGVGANFQTKLKALHHLDVPYRPSDMEQREGRIIRQGNTNVEVDIYSYITEKTFDSYSYQILENKQRFISQINKGDMSIREASDIDETTLSFAQIKAIATANPDFLRQMELINTIKELKMLKNKHCENEKSMKFKLTQSLPSELSRVKARYDNVCLDVKLLEENPKVIIDGITYEERAKAGETFAVVFANAKTGDVIGKYGEFDLSVNKEYSILQKKSSIKLIGNFTYEVEMGESGLGNITRIENEYKNINKLKPLLEGRIENIKKQLDELAEQIDKPFAREKELLSAERELSEIEERLQVNKEEVLDDLNEDKTEETKTQEKDRKNEEERF